MTGNAVSMGEAAGVVAALAAAGKRQPQDVTWQEGEAKTARKWASGPEPPARASCVYEVSLARAPEYPAAPAWATIRAAARRGGVH